MLKKAREGPSGRMRSTGTRLGGLRRRPTVGSVLGVLALLALAAGVAAAGGAARHGAPKFGGC